MTVNQDRPFGLLPRISLYVAFATTGAVTNLLGPTLPSLELRWLIDDRQAGELFTFQFAFSTLASIFASRNPRATAPLGMLLAACGVFLLSGGDMPTGRIAVALYGAGLGLAITSMNLLVAGEAGPAKKSFEIAMMNLVWVAGAILFPLLYSYLPQTSLFSLLIGIALLAAVSGAAIALQFPSTRAGRPEDVAGIGFRPISLLFALFFFLYVGAEVGVAGWLPTYVNRATLGSAGSVALAAFWGSLMIGRLLLPLLLRFLKHRTLLFLFLSLSLAAASLLASFNETLILVVAAGVVGFGLGPLFPLNLALFAHTVPPHKNSGWVLACAGMGAAVLPAWMGIISTRSNSLRVSLAIPILALVALIAISVFYREPRETVLPTA